MDKLRRTAILTFSRAGAAARWLALFLIAYPFFAAAWYVVYIQAAIIAGYQMGRYGRLEAEEPNA